jgi:hypothetical protein
MEAAEGFHVKRQNSSMNISLRNNVGPRNIWQESPGSGSQRRKQAL